MSPDYSQIRPKDGKFKVQTKDESGESLAKGYKKSCRIKRVVADIREEDDRPLQLLWGKRQYAPDKKILSKNSFARLQMDKQAEPEEKL